ncbi:MAG: hypothetical protein ACX93T_03910 [Bacteroidota bacterium]
MMEEEQLEQTGEPSAEQVRVPSLQASAIGGELVQPQKNHESADHKLFVTHNNAVKRKKYEYPSPRQSAHNNDVSLTEHGQIPSQGQGNTQTEVIQHKEVASSGDLLAKLQLERSKSKKLEKEQNVLYHILHGSHLATTKCASDHLQEREIQPTSGISNEMNISTGELIKALHFEFDKSKKLEDEQAILREELRISREVHAQYLVDAADKTKNILHANEVLQGTNSSLQQENKQLRQALDIEREESNKLKQELTSVKAESAMLMEVLSRKLATIEVKTREVHKEHREIMIKQRNLQIESQRKETRMLQAACVDSLKFGKQAWNRYFGDVGEEPPVPSHINNICSMPCPFSSGKAIQDTHLLVLVPSTVNGMPFTINLLDKLIQSPYNNGHPSQLRFHDNRVKEKLGERHSECSYWVLMRREILPNSRSRSYSEQKSNIDSLERAIGLDYTIPNVLEAATAISMHYVRSGERLYPNKPMTYTHCLDQIDEAYPIAVGGFSTSGLSICSVSCTLIEDFGISCLLKPID